MQSQSVLKFANLDLKASCLPGCLAAITSELPMWLVMKAYAIDVIQVVGNNDVY